MEWASHISSNALNTLYSRKMNKTQLLPITEDLLKLNTFISNSIKMNKERLQTFSDSESWKMLAYCLLARIILFNKRRSEEAARLTIDSYNSRPQWSEQSTTELKNSLTPFEVKLAERLAVVEIPGKRAKKVPVLLTDEVRVALDLLISKRTDCGISGNNPYIFACSKNSTQSLRGHDYLSKMCKLADLRNPELITATKLRKYVATVCQVFDLTETESDWLARHLGHDIRVHREFYRLHESTVELTKVSKLLMAVDEGKVSTFAGKSLADIDIDSK
ncbi:unnamed protein product [Acanthoscelides obtectus]|uniref:Uncharacterized protein n=1 Tax=Acanthoscelides obtectus TaxID=200917 RepID=A0A9P0P6G0_ACAOB|nr:unnamed protein product [Acanthoscelides obtectus]CAK1640964.1 hypothetical protein AOBTE_LOCUS12044 [Acanthoscelides obtectus]